MGNSYDIDDNIAHEHRVLLREYGRAQARCSTMQAEQVAQADRISQLEAQLMRARAQTLRMARLGLRRPLASPSVVIDFRRRSMRSSKSARQRRRQYTKAHEPPPIFCGAPLHRQMCPTTSCPFL